MIFVTVGASQSFDRLIEYIDKEIATRYDGKIIAQIHDSANYIPKNIEFFKTINKTEFDKYIKKADLIISHAGMGIIIDCIKYNKKFILVPRDCRKKECYDDHQNEICDYLKKNYKEIFIIHDLHDLYNHILLSITSSSPTFEDTKKNLFKLKKNLSDYLSKNPLKNSKIFIVCSSGGHLRQMLELLDIFPEKNIILITNRTKTKFKLDKVVIIGEKDPILSMLIKSSFRAIFLILRYRPSIIVTNGDGAISIPFSYFGKLLGSKVLFIETLSRVHSKSTAAQFHYPIADVFLIQWEKNLSKYGKKAKYWGSII